MPTPEKKPFVPSERESGELAHTMPITQELGQVLLQGIDTQAILTVPDLIDALGKPATDTEHMFNVLSAEHAAFKNPPIRNIDNAGQAAETVSILINGVERTVEKSIGDYLLATYYSLKAGMRMTTVHLLGMMIENDEPALYRMLDQKKMTGVDPHKFLVNFFNLYTEKHPSHEAQTGPELSVKMGQGVVNLLDQAERGELGQYRVPQVWLERLINGVRNDPVIVIDTSSDLESELIANTLAGQHAVAKHKPLRAEKIVYISRQYLTDHGSLGVDALFNQAKQGILFLPYSGEHRLEQSWLRAASRQGIKLVFYGDLDKSFDVRQVPVIYLDTPNEEEIAVMFETIKSQLEQQLGTEDQPLPISKSAVQAAIPLALRYAGLVDKTTLDALVMFMEKAASNIHIAEAQMPIFKKKKSGVRADNRIDASDIYQAVQDITSIEVKPEKPERFLTMDNELKQSIIGQDEAITAVSDAIRRAKSGLKDPRRPIANLMFLGPSGVGKTELTKALAKFLFGSEDQLTTFDMSEFMEKHTVSRLTGAPPGYVGYEEGGQLTEAVRKRPYSIVVFDEIEKAHPDVHNLLYQIMEEGRLTDGHSRKIDFRNTLVVMTGNVGSEWYLQLKELGESAIKGKVEEAAKQVFKTAFLNRLDKLIVFRSLDLTNILEIVDLQIRSVNKKLKDNNVTIKITPTLQSYLAQKAYNPAYGAREVRRVVQHEIEDQLGKSLINQEISAGSIVEYDLVEGKPVWRSIGRN